VPVFPNDSPTRVDAATQLGCSDQTRTRSKVAPNEPIFAAATLAGRENRRSTQTVSSVSYLPTNVVTVEAPSAMVKAPLLTGTAVPPMRFWLDDVTYGVIDAGAVPPAMVIGTLVADVFLLMATTTTVPSGPT
jgi:hypothetical protein